MTSNPRHLSESTEHYTPSNIVEAARAALGGTIDLDPASSSEAQATINAKAFFTKKNNGLHHAWHGTVFLNPPGGSCDDSGALVLKKTKDRGPCTETGDCGLPPGHEHRGLNSSQKFWWTRLAREYVAGHVKAAVFVSFSIELLQTSQIDPAILTPHDCAICFPSRRVAYVKADGTVGGSPPHSSMLVYLGKEPARFVMATMGLGRCMKPWSLGS